MDSESQELEEHLPDEARELMGDISPDPTQSFGSGVGNIFKNALGLLNPKIKTAAGLCFRILAVVILASVLRGVTPEGYSGPMELCAVLAIGTVCMGNVSGYLSALSETVDSMTFFSGALFSTLATAVACTGAAGSSAAIYSITMVVCSLLSKALELVILPVISCYMALTVANYAVGGDFLKSVSGLLMQTLTFILKAVVIGFTAYLSITGVISGSADTAAIKAAKLTISTAVPVVGSMIADASETLLVSTGLIKSGAGIFGLLGVLAVSIMPFLETGCCYLLLKMTAAAAGTVGEKSLGSFISDMAGAVGLITAVTGVCALLLMISCVCFMTVRVG